MNSETINANIRVHTKLIEAGEYQKSPHRKPESKQRIQNILKNMKFNTNEVNHLDVGCGDGFIFECVPNGWKSKGIDITPAMLQACSISHPRVELKEGRAEAIPFPDKFFDIVTCYSFLDHLEDTLKFYREIRRVLKPDGQIYLGLSPNREFFNGLEKTRQVQLSLSLKNVDLDSEMIKAFEDGLYYQENFGIDKDDLILCEPGKSKIKGLSSTEEIKKLNLCGINQVNPVYNWIFQENKINQNKIKIIREFLPFTSPCFKYFDLIREVK